MSIFGETYSDPLTDDPSPYEQAMAEILQAQRIMAQTKKLGDEHCRVGDHTPVGKDTTEAHSRSYQLFVGPIRARPKTPPKDPCARLMKALKLGPGVSGKAGKKLPASTSLQKILDPTKVGDEQWRKNLG